MSLADRYPFHHGLLGRRSPRSLRRGMQAAPTGGLVVAQLDEGSGSPTTSATAPNVAVHRSRSRAQSLQGAPDRVTVQPTALTMGRGGAGRVGCPIARQLRSSAVSAKPRKTCVGLGHNG